MQVEQREQEQIAAALAAVDANGSANERAEAVLVRQQLALHASYVEACKKLEACADAMQASGAHLVPLRFPLRLTPRTRTSVEDGVHRSFLRFLQDLHAAVEAQHAGALSNTAVDPSAFLGKLANVLTLELCRVLDGSVSNAEAVEVCVTYVGKCRAAVVREESAHLLGLDAACQVVIEVLARFSTRSAKISRAVPEKMRLFLRASERKGLSAAALRLAREPQLHDAIEKHRTWLFSEEGADDAKLVRIYELLLLTHVEFAQTLSWQRRRVAWLASTSSAHMCWCGITVSTGVEGVLVHAPAHMRCFAGDGRVRLMVERREAPFACYLSLASVANVVVELLRTLRLSLNRIDAAYASRILTFDFCKYESAARNILEDTVRPWCDRILLLDGVD
tara:strand:- start:2131 stop:3309 length:1179 start_codon:yes stop_codon:yes gene_type:complete